MARSLNSQGNRIEPAHYATELHLSRRQFNEANKVRNAFQREAEFQNSISRGELGFQLRELSNELDQAALERICKDIQNG